MGRCRGDGCMVGLGIGREERKDTWTACLGQNAYNNKTKPDHWFLSEERKGRRVRHRKKDKKKTNENKGGM